MRPSKTLSLSLLAAVASVWMAAPADAVVRFSVSSHKAYRQLESFDRRDTAYFRGGSLETELEDGQAFYIAGCAFNEYKFPGWTIGACAPGTTGFATFGGLDDDFLEGIELNDYFLISSLTPAVIIEPSLPDLAFLRAAPASELPRPLANFEDASLGVYFNLHTSSVREYRFTGYFSTRDYRRGTRQRTRFDEEIVPGVYHYSFPGLNRPNLPVALPATIFPFTDGPKVLNSQRTGFQFVTEGGRWTPGGFFELNVNRLNAIRWKGVKRSEVAINSDRMYFAIKFLSNPKRPGSAVDEFVFVEDPDDPDRQILEAASIYPPYRNDADPRILLRHPLITEFIVPPILETGKAGAVRVELVRALKTGGVTFDFSTRTFELPILTVDRYHDYALARFDGATKGRGLLSDFDKDGFNNMTEWVLDSLPDDSQSIPEAPQPDYHLEQTVGDFVYPEYYGFLVIKKKGLRPQVDYTIQRSVDNGETWQTMVSDRDWFVFEDEDQIRVVSRTGDPPDGTAGHRYRVKITRA
ncbi:MAG: hypothetical protein V4733_06020 [Verrucomicrobiota bacterium]